MGVRASWVNVRRCRLCFLVATPSSLNNLWLQNVRLEPVSSRAVTVRLLCGRSGLDTRTSTRGIGSQA